mgnify:CR=1 FL=1
MEFHLKKNLFLKDTSLSERFISSKSDVTFFNSTRQPTPRRDFPHADGTDEQRDERSA